MRVQKLSKTAKMPVRHYSYDSGMDIYSDIDCTIPPGEVRTVGIGLAICVESGQEIQVRSTSGLAKKSSIFVLNSPGTVDAGYTGEVGVILANFGKEAFQIKKGDKIAQIVVCPVIICHIEEVAFLEKSDRGDNGFGSTNKGSTKKRIQKLSKKAAEELAKKKIYTEIFTGVDTNNLKMVKSAVKKGADIHYQDDFVFWYAAGLGHFDIVKFLFEIGANINAVNNIALKNAAENGHLDVVEYLVENGADIHVDGGLPLVWAAEEGRLDVIKYLVKMGADPHAKNKWAIDLAEQKGHLDVVKYLNSFKKEL